MNVEIETVPGVWFKARRMVSGGVEGWEALVDAKPNELTVEGRAMGMWKGGRGAMDDINVLGVIKDDTDDCQ